MCLLGAPFARGAFQWLRQANNKSINRVLHSSNSVGVTLSLLLATEQQWESEKQMKMLLKQLRTQKDMNSSSKEQTMQLFLCCLNESLNSHSQFKKGNTFFNGFLWNVKHLN